MEMRSRTKTSGALRALLALSAAAALRPTFGEVLRGAPASGARGASPGASKPPAAPLAVHTSLTAAARTNNSASAAAKGAAAQSPTFESFYGSYSTGPGIWKWNNALTAYTRHLTKYAGKPVAIAEVGVQSGGSIQMWKAVLGSQCHVYGIDINPQTKQFADASTTITIGDQADVNMWSNFFTNVAKGPINALVDDGGHEAHQMLVTLTQAFPRISSSGIVAIEDIHGEAYTESFFTPAATFLAVQAQQGLLDSVHLYPFLLVVQRTPAPTDGIDNTITYPGSSVVVSELADLWAQVPLHAGGHVILENAGWGPFLTAQGLTNFFRHFSQLHGSSWFDMPTGCATTSAAVCTNRVYNNPMQSSITGIHVYPTRLVVEVASGPVIIEAVRKGTAWLSYR